MYLNKRGRAAEFLQNDCTILDISKVQPGLFNQSSVRFLQTKLFHISFEEVTAILKLMQNLQNTEHTWLFLFLEISSILYKVNTQCYYNVSSTFLFLPSNYKIYIWFTVTIIWTNSHQDDTDIWNEWYHAGQPLHTTKKSNFQINLKDIKLWNAEFKKQKNKNVSPF